MSRTPSYIPLPPPPAWNDLQLHDSDSAASPAPHFFTPPTSPTPSPNIFYTPPTSPFHDAVLYTSTSLLIPPPDTPAAPTPQPEDHFPLPTDVAIDLVLDDEGLSTLEKIYLYSRSKASFHRIFIAHRLPEYLDHVTPQEAVEYVLPLLSGLAMDDEDTVKEALAAELIPVIWWFFTHCQIIPDDLSTEEKYASSSTTVTISVQAFTPILGTLLLSETDRIGAVARHAIVECLTRMRKIDERETGSLSPRNRHPTIIPQQWELDDDENDYDVPASVGLFGRQERTLFTQEILQQIIVGMGRLDVEADYEEEAHVQEEEESYEQQFRQQQGGSRDHEGDWSNPYFPPSSFESLHATDRPASSSPASSSPESPQPPRRSPTLARSPLSSVTDLSPTPHSAVSEPPRVEASSAVSNAPGSPMNAEVDWDEYELDQGTLGRVACMSLVAAVTSGGPLEDETLESFLQEVERVVPDPSYRVRKAASFALGALAKVIPERLVPSLLPLFDSLRWDAYWEVRHSALFALPSILSRLASAQRRTVALETVVALSADQHPTVRSGVLESLGEVLHTFLNTPTGPPEELLRLFLGRREDRRVRNGQQFAMTAPTSISQTPLEAFYAHPKRPLICAFNFPAVALTLGASRWGELREAYQDLTENPEPDVLRTLAASLGELARIIGPENARRDLVDVWWRLLRSDKLVRPKVVESLEELVKVVGAGVGRALVEGVFKAWNEDVFKDWREREVIQKTLVAWLRLLGVESLTLFRGLLMKGLEDAAATVREAAISAIPEMWKLSSSDRRTLDDLSAWIRQLAKSPMAKRRMTFVACHQILVMSRDKDGQPLIPIDENSLRALADLANDDIEGVRIGVARLAALIYRDILRHKRLVPTILLELVHHLSQDASHEVQSYVADMSITESANRSDTPPPESKRAKERVMQAALFSRPPMVSKYSSQSWQGGGSRTASGVGSGSPGTNWTTPTATAAPEQGSGLASSTASRGSSQAASSPVLATAASGYSATTFGPAVRDQTTSANERVLVPG